ncbi:hypothetical protein [Micromonospora sp. HUAS LYJ1]|uniref:hypothetical protein n=1 Tax=Micromonospora sp. HUAS LYJ1 TaxID=3061626 RepID=UPI0026730CE4|nr:hypothetical protein [Micromonospora sp. HUAS LYJ1]WKU07183.1 hypothetical protein Q2K16_09100 [Micromonospora sp. HUAS LYJ1]
MSDLVDRSSDDLTPPGTASVDGVSTGAATQRLMAWSGLGTALATLLTLATDGPVAAPVALAFACLGPGLAVLAHLRVRQPVLGWAAALLVSVTGYAATATVQVWLGWWQPRAVVLTVAVLVALSCGLALRRLGWGPAPARPRLSGRGRLVGHAVVLVAATLLWLIAVARSDLGGLTGYGLLASVHPTFFAAVALCTGGFVLGLTRAGRTSGVQPLYLVLLVLIVHGTVPLLLDEPQYAWTYKHLGVVELIQSTGSVGDPTDIYQQWPTLFASAAQLADLSGQPAAVLADWSAVFFNLAGALLLAAVVRTLSPDRRVAELTVFGFVAVNWVEEDYLAPQALAFLLSLGVLLVLLHRLRRPDAAEGADRSTRRGRALAVAALLVVFAVLTATHQLSPYLVLAQVGALTLLRQIRPWWTVVAMGAILVAYLLPRYDLVAGSFGVFEGINIFANASGNADGWGSTGQAVSAIVVRCLALSVWGLAALAVLRSRRRLSTVLVPMVLAGTPFLLLVGQSYGGEAIYRVFLFSAPWCVLLIAIAVFAPRPAGEVDTASDTLDGDPSSAGRSTGTTGRRSRVRPVLLGLALTVAVLGTVQGRHGQLVVDRQDSAEVAAARQLYAEAAPGSTIALATANFPSRLTAAYPDFNRSVPVGEPDLVEGAGLRGVALGPEHLPAIESYLRSFGGTATYLVIGDGMRRQAAYFGHLPDGALDRLEAALRASSRWVVLFQGGDGVSVYQLTG